MSQKDARAQFFWHENTRKTLRVKSRKGSIARCFSVISMYGRPFSGKLFSKSSKISLAIVCERRCIPVAHCRLRANVLAPTFCSAGISFVQDCGTCCLTNSFHQNRRHAKCYSFVRIQLLDIGLCRPSRVANSIRKSGSVERKRQASQEVVSLVTWCSAIGDAQRRLKFAN